MDIFVRKTTGGTYSIVIDDHDTLGDVYHKAGKAAETEENSYELWLDGDVQIHGDSSSSICDVNLRHGSELVLAPNPKQIARKKLKDMGVSVSRFELYRVMNANNVSRLQLLLAAGVADELDDDTPLLLAIGAESEVCLQHLLEAGADANAASRSARTTPLLEAARRGLPRSVSHLLKAGAKVDMTLNQQVTPLMTACQNRKLETARLLLEAGADVHKKNGNGCTALHLASRAGCHECVGLLLERGALPDEESDDGVTAIFLAKTPAVVCRLARAGARVGGVNIEGMTPLCQAATVSSEFVSALLGVGADANATGNGTTPLFWACSSDLPCAVEALLSGGADPSIPNREGHTPLYRAACSGNERIVRLLLDAGAKPLAPVPGGTDTPFRRAQVHNHTKIVDIFKKRFPGHLGR